MFSNMTDKENNIENNGKSGKDTLKVYEVGYLLLPTLPEEKLGEEVASVRNLIEKNNGSFISEDFPKRKVLAYEMDKVIETKKFKFKEGYFGWVKFEVGSDAISNIEKGLKSNLNILRFLLINTARENTLYSPKVSIMKKDEVSVGGDISASEKAPASAEEIDKSIEALVIQ